MRDIASARTLVLAQAAARHDFKALYRLLAEEIGWTALRYAPSPDQPISPARRSAFLAAAGNVVMRYFVGADGRSPFADDGVTSLALYPRILNQAIYTATRLPVTAHRNWLKRHTPPDVFEWLSTVKSRQPVREDEDADRRQFLKRVQDLRIFHRNPLEQYEPSHTWIDPRGYTLSDRIWNAGTETRRRLDAMLTDAIRNGKSALEISKAAEAYLLPDRKGRRTNLPYGRDASMDGMRLARTEIARAHNCAAFAASAMNPYVSGIDWALSIMHPRPDVCDEKATIGMGGGRLRDPYSIDAADLPPAHPYCVTPGQLVITSRGVATIEDIKAGDYVLTHKGRYRRVTKAWSRPYDGLVHQIEAGAGRCETTSEHPIKLARGWINAEDVEAGDQVLYASIGIGANSAFSVAECSPPESEQSLISLGISGRVQGMPVVTVSLNNDTMLDQREIGTVYIDTQFLCVGNASSGECGGKRDLDRSETAKSLPAITGTKATTVSLLSLESITASAPIAAPEIPHMAAHISHNEMECARVAGLLGGANLPSDFGALGRVALSNLIEAGDGFMHPRLCISGARAVILRPSDRNASTDSAYTEIVHSHQQAELAESDTKTMTHGRSAKLLRQVEVDQNVAGRNAELLFNAATMSLGAGDATALDAVVIPAQLATDHAVRARFGHDNPLMLSPDMGGRGSGNPLVRQAATPSQAHLHYTPITALAEQQYDGLVYNMEVEEDNSYTVGGIVVHNCLCHTRAALIEDRASVTARLRQAMEEARRYNVDPFVNPSQADAFIELLLGLLLLGAIRGQADGLRQMLG